MSKPTFIDKILKDHLHEAIAAGIFLVAYYPTWANMWYHWWAADSYYSHGILIPFVCGYFIWQMREELKTVPRKESGWGLFWIIIGSVIYILAAMFRVNFVTGFSMYLVLNGLILHFYGSAFLKKIAFPVFFLLFMIPLPSVIIANLSFKLKLFAADLATIVLNNMNIPAIQEGSLIRMRHAFVVVDDVCSGLRSLISLGALGAIFAYWFKGPMFKRMFLFLMTIPIAIFTNMCRVVILAVVSEIWGPEYTEGFLHDFTGMMVFAVAFVLLYVTSKLIE